MSDFLLPCLKLDIEAAFKENIINTYNPYYDPYHDLVHGITGTSIFQTPIIDAAIEFQIEEEAFKTF